MPLLKRSRRLLVPPPSLWLSALLNVAIDSFICLICISASLSWQCAFCWQRKLVQNKERKLNVKKRKIPNNVIQKGKHINLILNENALTRNAVFCTIVRWLTLRTTPTLTLYQLIQSTTKYTNKQTNWTTSTTTTTIKTT